MIATYPDLFGTGETAAVNADRRVHPRVLAAQAAIDRALANPDILALLSKYGYDEARLYEGKALCLDTQAWLDQQTVADGEPDPSALKSLRDAWAKMEQAYTRTMRTAQVAFRSDPRVYTALRLNQERQSDVADWLAQITTFYARLLEQADWVAAMTSLGYDRRRLEAEAAQAQTVIEAYQHYEQSQRAYPTQEDAPILRELSSWIADFTAAAQKALRRHPRWLEELRLDWEPRPESDLSRRHSKPGSVRASYDQVPYPGLSYGQTHPDRLATLATLLGLAPAPVEHCRVLELGCASGGNLIPMAYGLPGSEFMGLDISPRQIAEGQARVDALGLRNLSLKCMDILDVTPELGQFDYVIAHGVYSWVPAGVQDQLLKICKQNLAPQGVAYVSYNTLPGWHMMNVIRDAMLYHTRNLTDPHERATRARALLDFLIESVSPDNLAYGSFLQAYASFLRGEIEGHGARRDALLLHDELAEINAPIYFHQFAEQAARHGLQYLVEADLASVFPDNLSPKVRQTLQEMARDLVEMEQYMDFLSNRMFRQTLLCHAEIAVQRTITPERLNTLYVTSRARPVSNAPNLRAVAVEKFRGPDGAIFSIDHPLSKAAMVCLGRLWPQAIAFQDLITAAGFELGIEAEAEDLSQDIKILAANLLRAYGYSTQLVELHTFVPALATEISNRPMASLVARLQAQDEALVTNLWHERVQLDAFQRHLIGLLDGTHDMSALVETLTNSASEGILAVHLQDQKITDSEMVRSVLAQDLDCHLRWLARAALLVA